MLSWVHSELGAFTFKESSFSWVRDFKLPTFERFTWPQTKNYDRSVVQLAFLADDKVSVQNEGMIRVALKVIANHQQLADEGVAMLYDDICGRGIGSGMWWNNDLDHVNHSLNRSGANLTCLEDMFALLGGASIVVQSVGYGYRAPCAIIGFNSPIDSEHGIGWLTDGERILGTGYRSDVSPNES